MNRLLQSEPTANYRCAGEFIKFKRKQMGLSQKYVAAKVKMSQSALSKIEAGVNDMPRKILEISDVLNLDHNIIMGISDKKPSDDLSDKHVFEELKSVLPNWKEILIAAIKKS